MDHLFYSLASEEVDNKPKELPSGLRLEIWRPSAISPTPPGLRRTTFFIWWLFHQFGFFANCGYGVAAVYRGETPVHYSCIFPGYFRFPFMGKDDLQIGDIWTDESCRGQGIASTVLNNILCETKRPGRRFWYLTEESNVFSIKLATGQGFKKHGEGTRSSRFGFRLFGSFIITVPAETKAKN